MNFKNGSGGAGASTNGADGYIEVTPSAGNQRGAVVFADFDNGQMIKAFTFENPDGSRAFGMAVGSLAILASTGFLTLYTLSCHSLRHIVGGKVDCFSCAVAGGPRQKTWAIVSILNEHHMGWAWWSLFFVCFADFYVRMCSMGRILDPRFF